MATVCVVGNATHDLIRTGLIAARRPGGTLVYATLALDALGHEAIPIGHAPLRAYWTLRFAGVDRSHLQLAFPGTHFLNEYEDQEREQWAREGPGLALEEPSLLDGADGVLLGPVLGEIPADVAAPDGVPSVLDLQGSIRRLGASRLWGWQRVELVDETPALPGSTHVRGSMAEVAPLVGTDDPAEAARRLAQAADRSAIVTMGPGGALAYQEGQVHRAALPAIAVDDPTGAGDVFDAGLLHGLLEGASLDRCLALGCAAARSFLEAADERRLVDRFPDRSTVDALAEDATA